MYEIDEEEVQAVRKVIQSKKFWRYERGRLGTCDKFEADFAKYLGTQHALTVTTGTNALIAALGACGIGPGDEVLVPAYTFVATAYAVTAVKAIPVVVNIDESFGMCPVDMVARTTPKTRAVIPVHMDGQPANVELILKMAKLSNLKVIEDGCQAMGGTLNGRHLGTFGDVGCFSFNQDKILSCGEGGAVVMSDRTLYERAAFMQDGASLFTTGLWKKATHETFMGGAMRVSEIQGAILQVQLERLPKILKHLRERKKIWLDAMEMSDAWTIPPSHDSSGDCGTSIYLSFASEVLAQKAFQVLRMKEINCVPLLARPGHAYWEWMEYLSNGKVAHHPALNPLRMTGRKNPFQFADYMTSLNQLQRTIKIIVDYDKTLTQTKAQANDARRTLETLFRPSRLESSL